MAVLMPLLMILLPPLETTSCLRTGISAVQEEVDYKPVREITSVSIEVTRACQSNLDAFNQKCQVMERDAMRLKTKNDAMRGLPVPPPQSVCNSLTEWVKEVGATGDSQWPPLDARGYGGAAGYLLYFLWPFSFGAFCDWECGPVLWTKQASRVAGFADFCIAHNLAPIEAGNNPKTARISQIWNTAEKLTDCPKAWNLPMWKQVSNMFFALQSSVTFKKGFVFAIIGDSDSPRPLRDTIMFQAEIPVILGALYRRGSDNERPFQFRVINLSKRFSDEAISEAFRDACEKSANMQSWEEIRDMRGIREPKRWSWHIQHCPTLETCKVTKKDFDNFPAFYCNDSL